MEVAKLSNNQLYALIQNRRLDASILNAIKAEFSQRNLSNEEINSVVQKYDEICLNSENKSLSFFFQLIIIAIPFPFLFQFYFLSLPIGALPYVAYIIVLHLAYPSLNKQKWKEFWKCVYIGAIAWTIAALIIGNFIFK